MYEIRIVAQDINIPNEAVIIKKVIPLIKEVLGYTDNEVELMIKNYFSRALAKGLNEKQVKLIAQPFYDIDAPIIIREYDNKGNTIEPAIPYYDEFFELVKQEPKKHYYDKPVVSREHLVAPDYTPDKPTIDLSPQPSKPTIKCPYCQSTNTKKITNTSKAVHTAFFGIFSIGRNAKNYHCNHCNSDF